MEKIPLFGINVLCEPVKLARNVATFTDEKHRVSVKIISASSIQLITTKGSYKLNLHPTLNIYQGELKGHKVHVTLKKVTGQVIYW